MNGKKKMNFFIAVDCDQVKSFDWKRLNKFASLAHHVLL